MIPEETLLNGRVVRKHLPTSDGTPVDPVHQLGRFLLARGELARMHNAEPAMRHIAYVELKEGLFRGAHYHRLREEHLYLISGRVLFSVEDIATKQRETCELGTGDLVIIPPEVAHLFEVEQSGHGVEFSATLYDAADTYRYPF